LAAAHASLARLEATGVIKPFVVRYPRWVLDDGTVLCEGSGPDPVVEATATDSKVGAVPAGKTESKSGREA
jgi:hypothetical protein